VHEVSAIKLTERQVVLLILVDEATRWDGDTRPGQGVPTHFVPGKNGNWSEFFQRHEHVSGSGDAASFHALERRGLIRPHPKYGRTSYWYAITEEGILQAEKAREARR
jgi:hypothetical protein